MEDKKNNLLKIIKRFFEPVKYDYWFLLKPFIRSIFRAVFVIYTVETFKKSSTLIQNNNYNDLIMHISIFALILIIYSFLSYIQRNVGWATMTYEGLKLFQNEWMPKFFQLQNTKVERLGTGKLINIMENGFKTWNKMFQDIVNIIPTILVIGGYSFIQIGKTGGFFALFIFSLTIVLTIFVGLMNKKAIQYRNQKNILESNYSRQFIKMLMSRMEIIQNNKMNHEINKTNKILSESTLANYKTNFYLWAMFEPMRWLCYILKISILIYGGYMVKTGISDFSQFVGLVAIVSIFENEMNRFLEFYKDFTRDFSQVQRLWDTFDDKISIADLNNGKKLHYRNGDIKIQNIDFSYEKSSVLENFSLDIKGGTKTAFVGESGSGKTTLIKLIAGYITPDQGNIQVDGQKLSDIKLTDYYKYIGYLTQDPSVFDGTIYENLVYALDKEPSQKKLEEVIKLSKCEFIYEFEYGLQTEIGERGIRLSGGQKQRLAIAKIMLKNPDIILLDEPTSALDSVNEEQINIALSNLFKNKTVIVIAHRLQTVKQADRILFFEEGKIIEDGTHKELVKLNGKYKKMLDLQSGF